MCQFFCKLINLKKLLGRKFHIERSFSPSYAKTWLRIYSKLETLPQEGRYFEDIYGKSVDTTAHGMSRKGLFSAGRTTLKDLLFPVLKLSVNGKSDTKAIQKRYLR